MGTIKDLRIRIAERLGYTEIFVDMYGDMVALNVHKTHHVTLPDWTKDVDLALELIPEDIDVELERATWDTGRGWRCYLRSYLPSEICGSGLTPAVAVCEAWLQLTVND